MLTNFAVCFSIRRQSCQYRRDYAWVMPSFPLPRQALQGLYATVNPRTEPHYYYTFAKVVDQQTRMVEKETEGYEIGVYMDIFPVDYVTDDLQEREQVFKKKKLLYKIRRCKISNSNPLQSKLAYIVYKHWPMSVKQLERTYGDYMTLPPVEQRVTHKFEAYDLTSE